MKIPLVNRLKRRVHIETALLQDELMDIIYQIESDAVLHGGTAIWRCYEGNRFSEDLDFYIEVKEDFEARFTKTLDERNLILLKYKKTENLIFAKITNQNVEVRLEINIKLKKEHIVKTYEKIDGSFIDIFTLSPEELILEKISAYKSRRLIRDIYDIYHLLRYVLNRTMISPQLREFLSKIEKPLDEENLKTILYSGAVPSFKQMLDSLR